LSSPSRGRGAVDVLHAGTANTVPGAEATLKYDVSDASWTDVASGGSGFVPCHYAATGANAADITTVLCLVIGRPVSVS